MSAVMEPWNLHRPPQLRMNLDHELVVDNFAGGGGASTGIEQALGRSVDIAINHDAEALAQHAANHPHTTHYCEDVFAVDPRTLCQGRPVGLAWFSPDCKHHSRAKGGAPVDRRIRALAWVAVRWAHLVRPRIIVLENVSEFEEWCPLGPDNRPRKDLKGLTFRRFVKQLQRRGYAVEWRILSACDYGAPTIRRRLFLIARCDGEPIVWPKPTHGDGLLPFNTAAECIDWSIPCPSIFERKRPLAEATERRIARGLQRFLFDAEQPFLIDGAAWLEAPTLIQTGYGERPGQVPRVPGLHKPLGTVVAGGAKHALISAFLAKHYGGVTGIDIRQPTGTVTARDHHALVASHLIKLRNNCDGQSHREPLHTIATGGHFGEVRAFLLKYYGTAVGQPTNEPMHTVTSKARFGLVTIQGDDYVLMDIGMRMLKPRELYRAQGFPDSFQIDLDVDGKPLTQEAQIRMCGNSVPPPFARALTLANYGSALAYREAMA